MFSQTTVYAGKNRFLRVSLLESFIYKHSYTTQENSSNWKSRTVVLMKCVEIIFICFFHLTTTSGRPEPEYALGRVMSSEQIHDGQLINDCKQMIKCVIQN